MSDLWAFLILGILYGVLDMVFDAYMKARKKKLVLFYRFAMMIIIFGSSIIIEVYDMSIVCVMLLIFMFIEKLKLYVKE